MLFLLILLPLLVLVFLFNVISFNKGLIRYHPPVKIDTTFIF